MGRCGGGGGGGGETARGKVGARKPGAGARPMTIMAGRTRATGFVRGDGLTEEGWELGNWDAAEVAARGGSHELLNYFPQEKVLG